MPVEKMNVAVVGCGKIASKHFSALDELAELAQLVAVCDADPARAEACGRKQGVQAFTDVAGMMERRADIDLVLVLVPTGLHAPLVVQLAPYGKAIVTEKPMALRVADCEEMLAACEASGAPFFVVYQNRYNRFVAAARRALESNRLGKIVLGSVRVRWKRDESYYESEPWRGTWALDGGVVSQQGSHHLDLLQWFLGPVTSVGCFTATRLIDVEVEDTAAAILRGESGALGAYEATVAARPENLEGSLSVMGQTGSIVIGGVNMNEVVTWAFADDPDRTGAAAVRETKDSASLHAQYLGDVIRAVRTGTPNPWLVDGREGLRNVELLTALYESAERGGEPVAPGTEAVHCRLGVVEVG